MTVTGFSRRRPRAYLFIDDHACAYLVSTAGSGLVIDMCSYALS